MAGTRDESAQFGGRDTPSVRAKGGAVLVLAATASGLAGATLAWSSPSPAPVFFAWIRDARYVGQGDLRQSRANDCGPAALTHALRQLGLAVPYPDPAFAVPLDRRGCGLDALAREAERRGVVVQMRRLPPTAVEEVQPPAVLHLAEGHFVAFDGKGGRGVFRLFDPSLGCLEQTPGQLSRHWSGWVLELKRGRRIP
jgi:hypothetical protein